MKFTWRIPWIIGLSFGLILLLIAGDTLSDWQKQDEAFRRSLAQTVLTGAAAVAGSIDREARLGQWEAVQEQLRHLALLDTASHFQMVAPDGLILADSRQLKPAGSVALPLVGQAWQARHSLTAPGPTPYSQVAAVPLAGPPGQPGAVLLDEVNWDQQFVEGQRNVLVNDLVIGLGIIVIAAIALGLVWGAVVLPLKQLSRLAEAVTFGQVDARAPFFHVIELQHLGAAFNHMLDRLTVQRQSLADLNQDLEAAVARRTAELQQAHTHLIDAIESLTEAFALYDAEDRLALCNSKYREFYDLSADLLLPGVRFEDHIRASAYRGQIAAAIGREEAWVQERVAQHQNPQDVHLQQLGNGRWLEINERKTREGGIVGVRTDITERKQAERALRESEERYRSLVEHTYDAIFCYEYDPPIPMSLPAEEQVRRIYSGRLVECNVIAARYYGSERIEDVLGKELTELFGAAPGGSVDELFTAFIRDGYRIVEGEGVEELPDGSKRYFSNNAHGVIEGGQLVRVWGVYRDITERKQAEQALRASEAHLRSILDNVVDGLITIDEQGFIETFNPAAEKIFGYTAAEVMRQNISLLMPEPYRSQHDNYLANYLRFGQAKVIGFGREVEGQCKDGSAFPLDLAVGEFYQGERRRFIGVVRDITRRKQAETMLQESELKYRTLVERIPAITYIAALDETSTTRYISPRQVDEILGFSGAEWQAESRDIWLQQLHPADRERVLAETTTHYDSVAPFAREYRMLSRDERVVWIRDEAVVVRDEAGQPLFLQGVMSDITRLKQAQEEIRRRNRELTLLNQVIAASAAGLEPETILETTCRELALAFEIPQAAAALLNEEKTAVVIPAEYLAEGRPPILNQVIPVKDNPAAQYVLNYKAPLVVKNAQSDPRLAPVHRLMRQRGTASLLVVPLTSAGEVIGCLALEAIEPRSFSSEDINLAWSVADQVAGALARVRHSRQRRLLSAAIEQSSDSIIITDTGGTIIYVNPAFEKITGYSRAEALGQTPRLLKSGRQEPAIYQELWAAITAGQVWHKRLLNQKKAGTFYTVDAIITPVRNENDEIINYVALERDMTHELQLEEQLRHSQKMEAIGRLAGGVAHDFNNLLTVIIGHSELLLTWFYDSADARYEEVTQIKKAGERAAELTRQLLAFSRQQPSQLQLLNLNQVVANLERMLQRLIGEHINLVVNQAPDLAQVRADPGQIEQVIMNLVVNARDAMPQGGQLTIKTANLELAKAEAAIYGLTPGRYAMLAVIDTGHGMDAETRRRIFEPYFTTKGLNKGTGLGLATVYGIVEQHGGHIQVESRPGQGAAFKIYLPQVEPAVKTATRPPASLPALEGTETILLVEDEAEVRLLTRKFLEKRGYIVLEADRAETALQLGRQQPEQIDLLVTDVLMPGMNGPELARQLTQLYPGLKVLYISGYADDVLNEYDTPNFKTILLDKPFSADALAHKVRQVLDSPKT